MTLLLPKPVAAPKQRKHIRRSSPPKRTSKPRSQSQRQSAKYMRARTRAWSLEVRRRAGNRCERCSFPGTPFVALDAHHLLTKKAHPAERLDTDNGMALCRFPCHHNAHSHRSEFKAWLRMWLDLRPVDGRTRFAEMAARGKA